MRNAKEAMAVANEEKTVMQDQKKLEKRNIAKKKFHYWLLGVCVSFLPILALPINNFISGVNLFLVLYELFCDISIMFIGISFTITALNDFITKCIEKEEDGWLLLNIVLLILGAIIYTIVVLQKNNNPEMEMGRVFWINLIYFIIMFLLSANKYIKQIREVR